MNLRILYTPAAILAAGLALAPPASAELTVQRFTELGDARARWIETTPPPGAGERSSMELFVRGSSRRDFGDAAYVEFEDFAATPPPAPPSYDFRASASGPSGGSPRLTMSFSDGGKGHLRPLTFTAGVWRRQGGSGGWDSYGGRCGFRSQQSYASLLDCHAGARVTGVGVWNDSSWLYPGGFTVLVDNVTYGGQTISSEASGVLGGVAESPEVGETVGVMPVEGEVLVQVPSGPASDDFLALRRGDDVPVGTLVDARDGTVRVRTALDEEGALQSGLFSDGLFEVLQSDTKASREVTEIRLRGGSFRNCYVSVPAREASFQTDGERRARARPAARRLSRRVNRRARAGVSSRYMRIRARRSASRVSRRGRGRRSAASARATTWDTYDRCDGTLTVVRRGSVTVRDLGSKRSVLLQTGERYLARVR